MSKLFERLSPIQQQRSRTKVQTSLARRGNIERGQGIAPITQQRAKREMQRKASRQGPIQRVASQQRKYGQQIASRSLGITSYNKLFEMLVADNPKDESRPVQRARLRNKEARSMLTRSNQRRLTMLKAALKNLLFSKDSPTR